MNLYLDTSTDLCLVRLDSREFSAPLGHAMGEQIYTFLRDCLAAVGASWADLTSITCFSGPGSFTGLRIGAAVANVLAATLSIPLYDHHGRALPIIVPDYGRPAHITPPRK